VTPPPPGEAERPPLRPRRTRAPAGGRGDTAASGHERMRESRASPAEPASQDLAELHSTFGNAAVATAASTGELPWLTPSPALATMEPPPGHPPTARPQYTSTEPESHPPPAASPHLKERPAPDRDTEVREEVDKAAPSTGAPTMGMPGATPAGPPKISEAAAGRQREEVARRAAALPAAAPAAPRAQPRAKKRCPG
jgi:hypothetical protein